MAVAGLNAGVRSILTSDREGAAFIQTSLAGHETSGTATFLVRSGQT
jgi:hypothetical protein